MLTPKNIARLLLKEISGSLTQQEQMLLDGWKNRSDNNRMFSQEIGQTTQLLEEVTLLNPEQLAQKRKKGFAQLQEKLDLSDVRHQEGKLIWWRYAAAIIVLLGLGVLGYIQLTKKEMGSNATPQAVAKAPIIEVLPGSDKAVLTLADGKSVVLDSSAGSILGGLGITNTDATISYLGSQKTSAINTLTTPRGGQYKLRLSDGTMVWLNAASSISYPALFSGKQREVTITGEVYFEVAKDAAHPFIVHTRAENISVLGTQFNINAYPDESFVKTSLVEGSVKIVNAVLKPGTAYAGGKIANTNIQQDIAWKDGYFNFNGADLAMVMRQLGRWYDVDIMYDKNVPERRFRGKLSRSLTLSEVLDILKLVQVKFELKGKILLVK